MIKKESPCGISSDLQKYSQNVVPSTNETYKQHVKPKQQMQKGNNRRSKSLKLKQNHKKFSKFIKNTAQKTEILASKTQKTDSLTKNFKGFSGFKSGSMSPIISSLRRFQKPNHLIVERRVQSYNYEGHKLGSHFISNLSFMSAEQVIDFVNSQIIGRNAVIVTPFGKKLKLYLDYTASGQEVKFIADELIKIEEEYANPHSESSYVGAYINHLLDQAESNIFRLLKASPDNYFIIDGGSGSTYSIEAAQKILGTYLCPKFKQYLAEAGEIFDFESLKEKLREKGLLPLVIVTHYEHHSNEITWRKQLCDVIDVRIGSDGYMDMDHLEIILKENYNKRTMIASLSAGSNITGIKTDVEATTRLCKKYDVPTFFDYAAVGPYVVIDLSKKTESGALLIDGIFLSPHKFLGGPGSCGLLVMNKKLYDSRLAPTHGGGGTVVFVGTKHEDYSENISVREKSGTPGIIQIMKCALTLELKGILQGLITEREERYNTIFFERMNKNKNFVILGPHDPRARVSIFSFLIKMDGPKGIRYLHHTLVVRLLSDVFGIQARAGCFCAGVYDHYLFNIDQKTSDIIRSLVVKHEGNREYIINAVKPGSTRISLHYTMCIEELEYVIFVLEFLCEHGKKFLPIYTFESSSAEWTHISYKWQPPRFGLGYILAEQGLYAKDENSRKALFEKQKEDAIDLLKNLPESKGYDSIPELGSLFNYYVEKGNISDREKLEEKMTLWQKNKEVKIPCNPKPT